MKNFLIGGLETTVVAVLLAASQGEAAPHSTVPVARAKSAVARQAPSNEKASLMALLPPPDQAQNDALVYLSAKSGGPIAMPRYPANDLLAWSRRRYEDLSAPDGALKGDSKALYQVIGENLLSARPLLADAGAQQQRRGLRVAHEASIKAAVRLRDKVACARIYDGFILPHLEAAPGGRGLLSRRHLLQDAASAYHQTGERDKEAGVLRLLVQAADQEKDRNQADRARLKLAAILESKGEYNEAIQVLQAVNTSGLSASKALIPRLQNELEEQKKLKEQPSQTAKTPAP